MVPKILAVATALAFAAQGVVGDECSRKYTVKEGDDCDTIARDQKVSTFQLFANNFKKLGNSCYGLKIDDVLCLARTKEEDCRDLHVVQGFQFCKDIPGPYGISIDKLLHNNPQIDDNGFNIYAGEVLCVAKETEVPPKPQGLVIPPRDQPDPDGSVPSGSVPSGSVPSGSATTCSDSTTTTTTTPPIPSST